MRESDKYSQYKRRFGFSGVTDFNKQNNLIIMNINNQEKLSEIAKKEKKK